MTITAWLECAIADADARGLPALRPLLENLARSTTALRAAAWNDDAADPDAAAAGQGATRSTDPSTVPDAR